MENCRLRPAGRWGPQAASEAMLADALHPQGVHPHDLPAPQDHPFVLRRLRKTLQETRGEGKRIWDITPSRNRRTHTSSPPHKRRRTDTGSIHSTPGAPHATQHDTPDPPASGATTQHRYRASHRRRTPRRIRSRGHQANRNPIADGRQQARQRAPLSPTSQVQARSRQNRQTRHNRPASAEASSRVEPEPHPVTSNP